MDLIDPTSSSSASSSLRYGLPIPTTVSEDEVRDRGQRVREGYNDVHDPQMIE